MSISHTEAEQSLRLAAEAETRSNTLRGYQSVAPHLLLWGAIYALGYTISQFAPNHAGAAWLALNIAGSAGSTVIGFADRRVTRNQGKQVVIFGIFVTFVTLVVATDFIMRPTDPRQIAAFIPLLVACAYVILGLGVGVRLVAAGIALGALTLIGYFALPDWFFLWMAVCGGATLIGSGLWLRQA